ncbi:MAG: J domain-containing protein [Proteobacteria bacterium]|nr:J domain-containing protein [Pseudomonadota bacterium]
MMASRDKFQGRVEDGVNRPCDWPGCESAGAFRAPLPHDLTGGKGGMADDHALRRMLEGGLDGREDDSAWFCLQHVREYNAEWDYFEGMNEDEINDFRDEDASWHRPTWPISEPGTGAGMGAGMGAAQGASGPWTGGGTFSDPHGVLRDGRGNGAGRNGAARNGAADGFKRSLTMADLEALRVLGLEEEASVADIKTSFKRLAKQHHPDLNGGDAESGKRLRAVIEAYNCLSEAFQDC